MALNLGEKNPLVKLARFIESQFGRKADYHFCVSKAMKADLKNRWGIE